MNTNTLLVLGAVAVALLFFLRRGTTGASTVGWGGQQYVAPYAQTGQSAGDYAESQLVQAGVDTAVGLIRTGADEVKEWVENWF